MIIITGFKPFDQEKENPSWEAVKSLPETVGGMTLFKMQLPVSYTDSFLLLKEQMEKTPQLRAVISVGQAKGRSAITPEGIAINKMYAPIADEAGASPFHLPITTAGPDAYFSTLPILAMSEAMGKQNIPAFISYHAGTYVCNSLMYQTLHYINLSKRNLPCGFIHVPLSSEQVSTSGQQQLPSLPITTISQGLALCVKQVASSLL